MNTTPTAPAVAPHMLSRQQRAALALGARPGVRLYRSRNGYGRGLDHVSLDVARSLMALGLMKVDRAGRDPELVLTHHGHMVEAVLSERRRKVA